MSFQLSKEQECDWSQEPGEPGTAREDRNEPQTFPQVIQVMAGHQIQNHSQRGWEQAPELCPGNPVMPGHLSLSPQLTDSSFQPGSFGGHLLDSRREIADLNIRIQKLRSCIVSQKSQVSPGGHKGTGVCWVGKWTGVTWDNGTGVTWGG